MFYPWLQTYLTNLLLFRVWSADRQHLCHLEIDRNVAFWVPHPRPTESKPSVYQDSQVICIHSQVCQALVSGQLLTGACASACNVAHIQVCAWASVGDVFPVCKRQL